MKEKYKRIVKNGRRIVEHLVIVEKVLGKKLPTGAVIHHVDGNGRNNENRNLVVCQNQSYHLLIHTRTDAYTACGNANWLKCQYCKRWDDPKNMRLFKQKRGTGVTGRHRFCHAEYEKLRRRAA